MKFLKRLIKKKTSTLSIFLVLISAIFTSFGQILLKSGVDAITNLPSVINPFLIFGFSLYAIALFLLLKAYKHGELSVLYPILALEYVGVVFLSNFLLGEQLNQWKVLGTISIFIGVTLIGLGGE